MVKLRHELGILHKITGGKEMKRKPKILAFLLALALILTFVPFMSAMAADEYTAQLLGQLDTGVSELISEWGMEDVDGNSVTFEIGKEVTISLEFAEPIKFTGNWTGISTTVPVISDADAVSTETKILSFIVDGEDLGSRAISLINRDDDGFLCLDIARQWGGDYDYYGLADMEPFSKIEITFIVTNEAAGVEDEPSEPSEPGEGPDLDAEYLAWIGGTFWVEEDEKYDWIPFEDHTVTFKINQPFTAVLDLGSETQTHDEAEFGYITVVQTNIMDDDTSFFDGYIHDILVDGRSIKFNKDNIEVGFDNGIRIALTNGWSEDPVVSNPGVIGTFSKLEVILALMQYDSPEPDFYAYLGVEEPEPSPTPSYAPASPSPAATDDGDEEGGNGLMIALIIGGVVLLVVIIVVVMMKKKK